MTTQPTQHRQLAPLFLTIALALSLHPGASSAGEQLQPTAPMAVARRGHTATVLADGRVLIAGGLDASGPLTAAEIFDPALKTFTLAGNLANARYGHTATLLANGRVLIAGGQDAVGPVDSAEIFEAASATPFRLLAASMGAARAGHTATLRSDGTVLLAGGDSAGTAEVFDPSTESFYTPLMHMAGPRFGHTATPLAEDNVFLVGGGTTSIELFNAASNSFSLWPVGLSQIRSGHSSIPTTSGQLLVIGGDQAGSFELFDPVSGSSPLSLSLSLGAPSSTANLLANNKILVLGSGVSGLFDETTSELSPLSGTNASSLQLAGHTATELPTANKQILVAGGIDSSNNLVSSATLYNPAVIATDAGDYPPFSWVNITGAGFLPNEMVTNQVQQIAGPAAGTYYAPWGVTANTNGAFATLWQVFSDELLNTTLKLTAVGQTSGLKAETEFADALTIASVSPNFGPTTGGTAVTITGSGFVSGQAPFTVTFDTTAVPGTRVDNTHLTATTPAHASGAVNVTVTDKTGSADTLSLGFTYNNNKVNTTTAVSSSLNPSVYGQSVSFSAAVTSTSGSPSGTVQFKTNGVNFGSAVALSGGSATSQSIASLAVGNYVVTAVYNGDSSFNTSTGTLTGGQTVNPKALTITAGNNSKTYGQTVTFAGTEFTTSGLVNSDTVTSVTLSSAGAAATATVSGSPYAITPSAAVGSGLGNYAISYHDAGIGLTVNTKGLDITANNRTKTYGDAVTFAGTEFSTGAGQLVNGDTVSSVTLSSAGAAATATVSGSPYAITPSAAVGTGLGNYAISYHDAPTGLTVDSKSLNITANNRTKTYGDTVIFAGSEFTTGSGELVNGDTVTSVTLSSAGAAATATVSGSPYAITPSAAVGSGLGNYAISYHDATVGLTVNTKGLDITANNRTKTYGDAVTFAGTEFSTGAGQLVNGDTVSSVTLSSAGAAATATVSGSPYAITPSAAVGSGLGNYAISYHDAPTGLTVDSKSLNITANNRTKTYGDTVIFAGSEFTTGSGELVNGDTVTSVTLSSAGAAATATVSGSPYAITPSAAVGTGLGNYAISYHDATVGLTVNTKGLDITANNRTKTYGDTVTFAGTEFSTGAGQLVNGDTVSSVTLSSAGAAATATVSGSPYAITPSAAVGSGLGNYAISYHDAGIGLTVNTKGLDITANNRTKTYGDAVTFAGTEFSTGAGQLVNGDTVSSVTLSSAGAAATATVSGSPYAITPSAAVGSGLGNYAISYHDATVGLTVNSKGLDITANNRTKTYGDTVIFAGSEFTTGSGELVNGDAVTSVTLSSAGAAATATVSGSPYAITPSAAVGTGLGNYAISYHDAPTGLTVDSKSLNITANNRTKTYGDTVIFAGSEFTTGSGELVNGDTVTSVTLSSAGAAATATVSGSPYAITPSAAVGTGLDNYAISYHDATVGLTVNTKGLDITANNRTKTYGDTVTFAGTEFSTGAGQLVNGDTVSSVTLSSAGAAATATVSGSPYAITPSAAVGSGLGNYAISYHDATVGLTVNTKGLDITANNRTKTYGDTVTFAGTEFSTGAGQLVNGDTVSSVTLSSAGAAATATVSGSPYAITPSAAVGSGLGNYAISYHDAPTGLTVNPKALYITAVTQGKTYGVTFMPNGATQFTSNGLVNGDTVSSVTLSSSGYAATATVTAPGPTYAIEPSAALGMGLGNYGITYVSGMLTITKAQTGAAIASSQNPTVFGNTIILTATVTDTTPSSTGTPTGTVTFKDGATTIGTGTLNGLGVATLTTSSLSVGSHTISVVYAGDGNFIGSTSPNLVQTILASVNATFLPPLAGQPVGNKIKVGQVVPHKVDLVNSLGQSVSSGVTLRLQVQGIQTTGTGTTVFQDVVEDANGVGADGTAAGYGIMYFTGGHFQFNLDTGNFSDPNTLAESNRYYTSTVTVVDNATSLILGSTTINLETSTNK